MSAIPKLGLVGLGLGIAELWLAGLYLGLVWLELMDLMNIVLQSLCENNLSKPPPESLHGSEFL